MGSRTASWQPRVWHGLGNVEFNRGRRQLHGYALPRKKKRAMNVSYRPDKVLGILIYAERRMIKVGTRIRSL